MDVQGGRHTDPTRSSVELGSEKTHATACTYTVIALVFPVTRSCVITTPQDENVIDHKTACVRCTASVIKYACIPTADRRGRQMLNRFISEQIFKYHTISAFDCTLPRLDVIIFYCCYDYYYFTL